MDYLIDPYRYSPITIVTSGIYPIFFSDAVNLQHAIAGGRLYIGVYSFMPENLDTTHTVVGGELRVMLLTYSQWAPENLNTTHTVAGGELRVLLLTYSQWAPENLNTTHTLTGGELRTLLITYAAWAPENLNTTHTIVGGLLQ